MRRNLNYLKDSSFLLKLDNEFNKTYQAKINVLDLEEAPVESIEGKVLPGSTITIDGNSSVRRTCSITFLAEDTNNDLTDIDNLLSINKKIEILIGIKNNIDRVHYDDIIWFPQGIYVIIQPSISQNANGCLITLSCKDKMCLLNGERGGNLPTSVTFHEYDQEIGSVEVESEEKLFDLVTAGQINEYTVYWYNEEITVHNEDEDINEIIYRPIYKMQNKQSGFKDVQPNIIGTKIQLPQRIYDIIYTLVCNYGYEDEERIYVNDLPLEMKQIVHQKTKVGKKEKKIDNPTLYFKEDGANCTYTLTPPPEGEDGQREFFTGDDIGYVYTDFTYPGELVSNIGDNVCTILDKIKNTLSNYEYFYDIDGNFVFQEIQNYLNNAYDPTDEYRLDENRKVYINDSLTPYNKIAIINDSNYMVEYNSNTRVAYTFNEDTGLITSYSNTLSYSNLKNDFHIQGKNDNKDVIHYHLVIKRKPKNFNTYKVIYLSDGRIRLKTDADSGYVLYTPEDWRAELYLQGMQAQKEQRRPDVYQQELLDLFDDIYDFQAKKFKGDLINHPNSLKYFFDYLEPLSGLGDSSVDVIKTKIHSYQQDGIKRLYNVDIPDQVIIDKNMDSVSKEILIEQLESQGQKYVELDNDIYSKITIGTYCYTAQETAQELLYQHTNYNETIVLQAVPIYYLEPNTRISVYNQKAGIYGDYVIKSISLPIDAGSIMTINAIRARERI